MSMPVHLSVCLPIRPTAVTQTYYMSSLIYLISISNVLILDLMLIKFWTNWIEFNW